MTKRDDVDDDLKSALSGNEGATSGLQNFNTQAVLVSFLFKFLTALNYKNFIDLAGSERASIHETGAVTSVPIGATIRNPSPFGSTNQISTKNKQTMNSQTLTNLRIREGQHINKSLFFLTQVIAMQAEGNRDHIPFRNSPLTKILKTSLGGNSLTAIILCITPSIKQLEQTQSTLRFG